MTTKVMNHSEYQKKVKKMSVVELRHVINDCRAVLQAWPQHPNEGYYLDEIHYCSMELARRQKG